MKKILITPRSFASISQKAIEILRKAEFELIINKTGKNYNEIQLIELIKDVEAVIVGTDSLTKEVLVEAKELKFISKYGVGLDNIDLEYAAMQGIKVANTPDANTNAVAELVIAFLFALARQITVADTKTKNNYQGKIVGNEIKNKTLGLLGLGKIGKKTAEKAKNLGLKIIAYDQKIDYDFAAKHQVVEVDFNALITESDFLSCHIPLNIATKNIISVKELMQMKNSAFIINTARSGIIDEIALLKAIKEHKIAGAALDTFDQKILSAIKDNEFVRNRLVLSPHMGAHTEEAIEAMSYQAAKNTIDFFTGKIVKDLIS